MNRTLWFPVIAIACFVATTAASFSADAPAEPRPHVVVVGNAIRVQGTIPFKPNMTVAEAIGDAGGISEFAAARAYLIRNAKSTRIDLRAIIVDPKKDVPLEPWDIIYVLQ